MFKAKHGGGAQPALLRLRRGIESSRPALGYYHQLRERERERERDSFGKVNKAINILLVSDF
jgi:hypothetical protein